MDVKDTKNSPVGNVNVQMTAFYGFYLGGGEYYKGYKVVNGVTNSDGFVLLEAWVDATDYWPEYYYFERMYVIVTNSDYTVLSSTNTASYFPNAAGGFTVVYDRDGDSVDDNFELFLAEKFKPVLHKHSYDLQQNLDSFDRILQGGYLTLKVFNDLGQLISTQAITGGESAAHKWETWHWDTYGWGNVSHGFYYLNIHDTQRYVGAPVDQRPLYYHVYYDDGYYYVQYWYFFGMNDLREQLSGTLETWHEGDWEHVSIRISEQGISYIPDKINFYTHEGGRTFNASECWWSASNISTYNGINQGYIDNQYTHLNIWLAANSHASYNRYSTVYKTGIVGIYYHDRVDYSPGGNDLYFEYDTLVKFGEVLKSRLTECPVSGYTLEYHCYPIKFSKHWLAYLGRVGVWHNYPVLPGLGYGSASPTMPAHEGISHEWRNFTINFSGFGNSDANWIVDDAIGD